jgi:hypothetical protein
MAFRFERIPWGYMVVAMILPVINSTFGGCILCIIIFEIIWIQMFIVEDAFRIGIISGVRAV